MVGVIGGTLVSAPQTPPLPLDFNFSMLAAFTTKVGYAQLMQIDTSLPLGVRENATEIKNACDFLLTLMNDILDLSRIESGKLQLELETVAIS